MADASAASNEAPQPDEASPGAADLPPESAAVSGAEAPAAELIETAAPPEPVASEPVGPEPTPTPPAPAPETSSPAPAAPASPSVATTIEVPPLEAGEGGEWELLVAKVQQWLAGGQLQVLLSTLRQPLTLVAYLVVALVVLQIVGALLDVLDDLPLVPGLLELVGVITVVRFGLTRLVRSSDRQQVIDDLKRRWQAFRGES